MLATPLPIGWQKDYDYQSPRLLVALESGRAGNLQPTQDLDWRCDFYSLAAMLRRYLPDETQTAVDGGQRGWTAKRYDSARTLIFRLRDCHDGAFSIWRPHRGLMEVTGSHLAETDLAASLAEGWTLARDVEIAAAPSLVTPLTRIAAPLQTTDVTSASLVTAATIVVPAVLRTPRARSTQEIPSLGRVAEPTRPRREAARSAMLGLAAGVALACPAYVGDPRIPSRIKHEKLSPTCVRASARNPNRRSRRWRARNHARLPPCLRRPRRLQAQPKLRSLRPGPQIRGGRRARE